MLTWAMNIKKAVEMWVGHLKATKSENTVRAYRVDIGSFVDFVYRGKRGRHSVGVIASLKPVQVQRWVDSMGEQYQASTVRQKAITASIFCKYLMKYGLLEFNPLDGVKLPKISRKLPSVTTFEALSVAWEGDDGDWLDKRNRALFMMLYGCGLRISEALALTVDEWCDAKEKRSLHVTGKGSKDRMVPLPQAVVDKMNRYIEACPYLPTHEGDPIFMSHTGKQLTVKRVQKLVRGLRDILPSDTTPHSFRHAFATHLVEGGADLVTVQGLLGHANVATTTIYTHMDTKRMARVYERAHPLGG